MHTARSASHSRHGGGQAIGARRRSACSGSAARRAFESHLPPRKARKHTINSWHHN